MKRGTVRVLIDEVDVLFDAAPDHLAGRVGVQSMDGKIAAHSMSRSRSPIAWNRSDLSWKWR